MRQGQKVLLQGRSDGGDWGIPGGAKEHPTGNVRWPMDNSNIHEDDEIEES